MSPVEPLRVEQLAWRCDPQQFSFQTTDELPDLYRVVGQARALESLQFGIGIRHEGYNLYVLGPPGVGKRSIVKQFLEERSGKEPTPPDWCYVQNFQQAHKPQALRLPAGSGSQLRQDMEALVEDLTTVIPAALEADEHKGRVEQLQHEAIDRHDQAFQQLAEKAISQGIRLVRTPGGFALAPVQDGEVLTPEQYEKMTKAQKEEIENKTKLLQTELKELIEKVPLWRKELREKVKQLNRDATGHAIKHSFAQIKQKYQDLPEVLAYLEAVEGDVTEHADDFHRSDEEPAMVLGVPVADHRTFQRYQVNLLVDNGQTKGAPLIREDHPNYGNLIGRVEYQSSMGTLVTDFTLIKPGALHLANGGYLVVEAFRVLMQPYAWDALKRALYSRNVKIESLAESLSLISTVSLEPEPIPLDLKVILLGDRMLYYLLYQYDRDFAELFKVAADFEDEVDRRPEFCQVYAQLIATLARRYKNRPFNSAAVARVLEHCARVSGDSEKLTAHMQTIADLLREADYWASQHAAEVVRAEHVEQAIDQQVHRVDRLRERIQQEIRRGTLLIDTEGEQIGQVNGLSVLDLGNFMFGRPSRITATARIGKGEVVDIEREVELGGAIHSKGILILSSFLAARYAQDHPLSLEASLVFEQSYGMVDGDSASTAELCALLSTLAAAPIKQSLAVTGSVNQHGQVQPIGGVNEKIEGFFDVCYQRGLTGEQGVLIPETNVKNLMLRRDVIEAVTAGKFHVFPLKTVDEAIALLTGIPAGERDKSGKYPEGSVNQRVQSRLLGLFQLRQSYSAEKKEGEVT